MVGQQEHLAELQRKLDRVCTGIDVVQDKQELMSDDISKIKEAVYNPDSGLYARMRDLEQWKDTYSKVSWAVAATLLALVTASIYNVLIGV